MAAPNLEEIMLGGFAYIAEAGTTIDAQTVSHLIKPDVDPLSNWTAGNLGSIIEFRQGADTEDDPVNVPSPLGGYERVNRVTTLQDYLVIRTREMGEWTHRLRHGLATKIDKGVAQTPGAVSDRKIIVWLRLQARKQTGVDLYIHDWWAEMRLTEEQVFNNKYTTPSLRFNLIKAVNGALVAGNSINFPV